MQITLKYQYSVDILLYWLKHHHVSDVVQKLYFFKIKFIRNYVLRIIVTLLNIKTYSNINNMKN